VAEGLALLLFGNLSAGWEQAAGAP